MSWAGVVALVREGSGESGNIFSKSNKQDFLMDGTRDMRVREASRHYLSRILF